MKPASLDSRCCIICCARVRALLADPQRLQQWQHACTCLRRVDQEVASLLFDGICPAVPWWHGKTWPLPLLLLGAIAAVIVSPLAWLATFGIAYVLMSTQMRYHDRVEAWQRALDALQMLLRANSLLGGRAQEGDSALDSFGATMRQGGRINRALSRSPMATLVPGARSYSDWFMLDNVNHYFKTAKLVDEQRAFLRDCFERVAMLEADIALARHLQSATPVCWAERRADRGVDLEGMLHPLLPQARPLTLKVETGGAFISGQNGIGKSTLLRTVGINLVTARAFGFCYAARACVPVLLVCSSMQSEDAMLGGESLYMAELRRATELLALAEGPHPGFFIIDEIFRGTNHLESVSAAAAILDLLASRGTVIVSSHNLVLAPLLAHRLAPLCVGSDADGVLMLAPGVLAHTNGIALLSAHGFGAQVAANAGKVADWLSAYLAHPADCSGVLSEGEPPSISRAAAASPCR